MQEISYRTREFDPGSDTGGEPDIQRSGEAGASGNGSGSNGHCVTGHEIGPLREELELARQELSVLQKERLDLEHTIRNLTALVSTDEPTGLRNRQRFKEDLESACAFASRHNLILSVIVLDLDDFRAYKESFGERAGDDALRTVAGILNNATRAYDAVARHGGGGFALLLPSTDRFDACRIAERLRLALITYDWPLRAITSSFGVTTHESAAVAPMELLDQAKLALRHARRGGKNGLVHFTEIADRSLTDRRNGGIERSRTESLTAFQNAITD
jgi:diguanylate cyclase (GGDEF)-like protein